MRIKYFVGKDRTKDRKKEKAQKAGPAVCRTCGDGFNAAGFCAKCAATLELYRDVDNQRFAEFQSKQRSK